MRRAMRAVWMVLLVGAAFLIGRWHQAAPGSRHSGLTIEQVQALSELVTTRVDVADVQETTVKGYLGARRVVLLIKGDLLISIDLSQARFDSLDEDQRQAVLVLPQPQVLSARLDHERTRIVDAGGSGLWLLVPGDAGRTATINLAFAEAQAYVGIAGANPALLHRSRKQAEQTLRLFLQSLGWEVRIRWMP